MLEKLKFWERKVEREVSDEIYEISRKLDDLFMRHSSADRKIHDKLEMKDSKRFKQMRALIHNQEVLEKKLTKIIGLLEDLKKDQEGIPKKLVDEIKEIQGLKKELIPRKIMQIISELGGEAQSGELMQECRDRDICSKSIFYQYVDKMVDKGLLEKERDGRYVYYRITSRSPQLEE